MLIIKNKIIETDLETILYDIKSKTNYLNQIKRHGENIGITCPFHKDGQESKPSCYVYAGNDNTQAGIFHCFTCGSKGPFQLLVAKCLDITVEQAEEWLIDNYASAIIDVGLYIDPLQEEKTVEYLDESILDKYSYLHPYQFKRGLSEEIIKKFKVGWNPETDSITFPVWDSKNRLVGITERSTKTKRFYIPDKMDKPVYLLNFIIKENIKSVVVCESQINALTCWTWGYPAVALIGTGSKSQYEILKHSGIRVFNLAFDGDLAGEHGDMRFTKAMPSDIIVNHIKIPRGKDVNDLCKEEFEVLYNDRS